MSNRLTFSLASLILMFAFGLIFAPMSVMAHDVVDDDEDAPATVGLQHVAGTTLTQAEHDAQHLDAPTVESIELVDIMVGSPAVSTVRGDTVRLVTETGSPALITTDTAGVFVVKITFSDALYTARDGATLATLTDDHLMITAAAKSDPSPSNDLYEDSVAADAVYIADPTPDDPTTAATEANTGKVFYVTFTVGADIFQIGDTTVDESDETTGLPIDVWIIVNANVGLVPTGLVDGTTTYGTPNDASMRRMFTIVSAFGNRAPTITTTTTAPTAAVTTGSFDVMYSTMDADEDTVTVTPSLDTAAVTAGYIVAPESLSTATGMFTITQPAATANNRNVPAATVTITLNAADAATPSNPAATPVELMIPFAARTYQVTPITIASGSGIVDTGLGMADVGPGTSNLVFTLTTPTGTTAAPMVAVFQNDQILAANQFSVTGSGTSYMLRVGRTAFVTSTRIIARPGSGFELLHVAPGTPAPAAAMISAFTVTVDSMGPSVASVSLPTGLPTDGGAFQVTIEFSEKLGRAPTAADFTVTNGAISNIGAIGTDGTMYTAMLTPNHGVHTGNTDATKQSVEIRLNAGLTDQFNNPSMATPATAAVKFSPLKATTAPPPTPTAPGAPTGLTAVANDEANTITLSWTAPTDTGNAPITAYTVTKTYTMDGTPASKMIDAGTALTITIPPEGEDALAQGVEFTFSVTATNSAGTSVASDTAMATLTVDPIALAFSDEIADQTFMVGKAIGTTAMPYLQLPHAIGGDLGYVYTLHKGVGQVDITATGDNGLTLDRVNLRLMGSPTTADAQGTMYTWRVTDKSGEGNIISETFTIVVNPAAPTVPDAPTAVMATADQAADTVMISWTAPANGGGATITGYTITQTGAAAMTYTAAGDATSHTTGALAVGTYSFTVMATNSVGNSVASAAAMATINPVAGDTAPPTVTISISGPDAMGKISFTFMFNEALGNGANALQYGDITVTGGTATEADFDATTNTLKVSPNEGESVTVSLNQGSVADMAGNLIDVSDGSATATYDQTAPMPTITSAAGTGTMMDKVVFTIDFNEALSDGLSVGDLEVSNAAPLSLADLVMATGTLPEGVAARYTLTVTPTDATMPVGLMIKAGTVADMKGNPLDLTSATYTPMAPTAPAAPTGLAGAATTDMHGSVTFTWTIVTGAMYEYSTDSGTTWKDVATAGSQVVSSTTAVTFSVRVKAAGNVPAGMAATAAATPTAAPPAAVDGQFEFPAESHTVIVRDSTHATLPAGVTPMMWPGMPDLENLLYTGGTIALTTADAAIDHDGKADTDMVKPGTRNLVITEVMWARNLAEVGTDKELDHQWIEVYNNLKVPVTAKLRTKQGQPALGAGSSEILLDRLSNVVGARWQLTGVGQNGYDDGNAQTENTDFISMFRKERGKDGANKGHWAQSTETYLANHRGTPGAKERSQVGTVTATSFNVGGLIFNEISNRPDAEKAYEWIEFRNKSGGEFNPKNRRISIITAVGSDNPFFVFPNNDNAKIAAGGLLLVVASDPSADPAHPLAAGWNVAKNAANQVNGVNSSSPRYLVANFGDGLPDDGEFVLILRSRNHGDDVGKASNIVDIAGYSTKLKVSGNEAGYTNLWPLTGGVQDAQLGNNKLEVGQVHRRQKDNIWGTSSTNYGRNGGNHHDDTAWRNVGWTGVGYKRNAAATGVNGGTPGYPNNAVKSADIAQGSQVIISEIMYDTSRNLPQWIELQNLSNSVGVNIDNWSIFVVNHNLMGADGADYTDGKLSERIDLDGRIPPGQTFLIVSTGNRNDTQLPIERVHNLRRGRGAKLLNPYGFRIELKAKTNEGDANKHQTVDDVGNLPNKPDSRRPDAQSFMDPVWELPSGTTDGGDRVSIARKTTKKMDANHPNRRGELLNLKITGVTEWGWIRSDSDPRLSRMPSSTYYGHASDIGSPGQTVGSVLPVELSKFRPERLATGEIVIRWATESELNNAGFNILRSETRDGEFTKLNTQLIAGQGTTSERTAYEFVDKSAKPNVVYYYQIQDVSIDGDVATLRTTRLRGHVSPAGKATTTWGELKALQ